MLAPATGPAVGLSAQGPSGGAHSLAHAYWEMCNWEYRNLRMFLPMLTSVLVLQGAGLVLGIGLFFHHIPPSAALYVATGVPVLNLLTLGLIFEPQIVADRRAEGSYEFLRSMPVPRSMMMLAWYTVSLVPSLPALVLSLVVAVARYHLHLAVSPAIIPAIVATSLTGTLLGYALAHGIPSPMVTRLASTTLIFILFGFSPIMFPASQLPAWLVSANRWLPFGSMATIIRSALVHGLATPAGAGRAYVTVCAWGALAALVSARVVRHRR